MQVRRIATLTFAALLFAVVSAAAQTINISDLPPEIELGGSRTGFGHSQTVVSNQYGYFATYIQQADSNLSARWRLVRSTDGGNTFTILYKGCPDDAPVSACPSGSAPTLETDRDGNIYLIYSDGLAGNAYIMRFLAANNWANPTSQALPLGAAQKFSAVIDESRGQIYYIAAYHDPDPASINTFWFFTIALDGSSLSRVRLTQPQPGRTVDAQYPHLYLDEQNHLYVAWTAVVDQPEWSSNYFSIHFMRSRDGASTWENLHGQPITLPVVPHPVDPPAPPGPTHEVNLATERNQAPYLWTMIVKQGKAHFWYRSNVDQQPMHYVRFDTVTGARDLDATPVWGGTNYSLSAMHGDCSTSRERLDSTIYCVSTTPGTNVRLAVVKTTDNGQTWQDYAATAPTPGCDWKCYYAVGMARQITEEGRIVGSYMHATDPIENGWPLKFFSVPVDLGPAPRLSTNWVNVSSQQAQYPGGYATDGNPNTTWVASPATPPNDAWIQIDLGSIRPITRLKWLGAPWSPAGAQSPANYRIEVSPDLVTYRTIVNRTNGDVGVIEGDELLAVTARYITLIVTKVNDGTGWLTGLREFWAEGPTP